MWKRHTRGCRKTIQEDRANRMIECVQPFAYGHNQVLWERVDKSRSVGFVRRATVEHIRSCPWRDGSQCAGSASTQKQSSREGQAACTGICSVARGNYFPGICSRSRSVYRPNSDRRSRMIPSGTKRGWRCVHANERKIWDELRTWDQARSVRIESLSVCSRLLCRRAAKWLVIFSASVCLIVSVVFRL